MNYQRAAQFINTHGDEVDKARLKFLLDGSVPPQDIRVRAFAGQREDGAFAPPWNPKYGSLDATCFRLAKAESMGITQTHPNVQLALANIQSRQNKNGSWEEDAGAADTAPAWVMPGDKQAQAYVTAQCGLWCAAWGNPNTAQNAANFLLLRMDAENKINSFLQTSWLAAGLFAKLGMRELALKLVVFLGEQVSDLDASELTWLICALALGGFPSNHALMYSAVLRLEKLQHRDGFWQNNENAEGVMKPDLHTTLEALRAMKFCKRF